MKKIFTIAKWEYLEKVKTKTFLISLIVTPAIIILFSLAPALLTKQGESSTRAVGMIDTSGIYFSKFNTELARYKLKDGQPSFILINLTGNQDNLNELKSGADRSTLSGQIGGYLLILNGGTDSLKAEFRSKTAGNFQDINKLQEAFNAAKIKLELTSAGVNPKVLKSIEKRVSIKSLKVEKGGKESENDFLTLFFTSFVFIILLMMVILSSGGMLIRSLVEEKSNRLIEILISSCTPDELLTGKVLGLSSLGLTQMIVWTLIGTALVGSSVITPDTFTNLLPILIYFLLGFVFYTAIFVGIGSVVTTEQEAQQLTSYLSLVLIMPIIITIPAIENPNTIYVHILSYIPFTIPSIMILRFNISVVPAWEIFISSAIMLLSIYLMIDIAAKVFKIGILSYGKRPTLKELSEWIREK